MRRFVLFLVAVLCTLPAGAQTQYETYTGWAVPTTPVLPAVEAHPQLWFGTSDLTALRAKWADPAYAQLVAGIRSEINTFKSRSAAATSPNDRPKMARILAFAWQMDGDLVARVRGQQALALAYQNVTRDATDAAFDNDTDEIYRATWLQNYCDAYDWLHEALSPQEEATIRAALLEETALLADNMVSGVRYASRPHNHRSKPAYALGTAALTFSGDPRAAGWLQFALEQQNTTTRYQFSADGVYREGSHYWLYNLVNAIPFMWQYRRAGVDLFPAYQPTFEWAVNVRTGRGWLPALEDGFPKPAPTHVVAAAYRTAPTSLHPTAPLGEILQWNWQTTDFFTANYTGASNDIVWSINEFLTMDATIPATAPTVSPTRRIESGQVVFRSDWEAGQRSTRHLLFHGVASADNHDHPDLMSYVLDAENTPLSVDAGYGPGGFSDDRRAWYTSAQAHNIVTVDGFPSRDFSTFQNQGPEQTVFVDGPAVDIAEMRAPNNGVAGGATVTRGVAFLDDRYFVVYDQIEASASASLQVHVHGRGLPSRTGNSVTWTAPNDAHGDGGKLHAAFVADGPLVFDEINGWTSFYFSREETQRSIAARRNAAGATFLHSLVATDAAGSAPVLTDLTAGALVSAEISVGGANGEAWHVATQRTAGTRTAGPITTDAAFAAIASSGAVASRWGTVRATTLQWDAVPLVETSTPLSLSADLVSDPTRHVLAVAPFSGSATITLQLRPATLTALGVTLDGTPVSFEALSGGRVRFTISAAGTVVIAHNGLVSSEPTGAAPTLRLRASPNPSTESVQLDLDVPAPGVVRVEVFDLLGRRVRTLADGPRAAGSLSFVWNGLTDGATVAAPGVYTVVAEAAGQRVRTLLTRLR